METSTSSSFVKELASSRLHVGHCMIKHKKLLVDQGIESELWDCHLRPLFHMPLSWFKGGSKYAGAIVAFSGQII